MSGNSTEPGTKTTNQQLCATWRPAYTVRFVFRAQPGRVSAPPINFGSVVIGGFSPRYFPPGTHHGPRSCNYPGTSKAGFLFAPRFCISWPPIAHGAHDRSPDS